MMMAPKLHFFRQFAARTLSFTNGGIAQLIRVGLGKQSLEVLPRRLLALLASSLAMGIEILQPAKSSAAASIQSRKNCTLRRLTRGWPRFLDIIRAAGRELVLPLVIGHRPHQKPAAGIKLQRRQRPFCFVQSASRTSAATVAVLDNLQILDRHPRRKIQTNFERQRTASVQMKHMARRADPPPSVATAARWSRTRGPRPAPPTNPPRRSPRRK